MRRSMFSRAASRFGEAEVLAVVRMGAVLLVGGEEMWAGAVTVSSWTDGSPLTRRDGRRAAAMSAMVSSSVMMGRAALLPEVVGGRAMRVATSSRAAW